MSDRIQRVIVEERRALLGYARLRLRLVYSRPPEPAPPCPMPAPEMPTVNPRLIVTQQRGCVPSLGRTRKDRA